MPKISHLMGRVAEKLEAMPRVRRSAARAFVALRRILSKLGIGLPRQAPAGLRKLRGLYYDRGNGVVGESPGPRILVVSPRAWATHLLMDTLLAESLKIRGADAMVWSCGIDMPVCHITNINEGPPMPCAGCKRSQSDVLDASGLPRIMSSQFTDSETIKRLKGHIDGMNRDEILSQVTEGIKLGDIVRDAINWFCLTVDIPNDKKTLDLLRNFLLLAEATLHASRAIFERVRPDLVIMLNGVFTEESIVRILCQQTGTPYITYERAFGFNQFVVCRNQLANHFDLSGVWNQFKDAPLNEREEGDLDNILSNWRRGQGSVVRYWESPEERESVILESLGARANTRILTMFTNVVWDTAMFGLNVVFTDMWDWVSSTIRMVQANTDVHLVIRVHPAEIKLRGSETRDRIVDRINREFPKLPANVSIITPESIFSSYKLIALSDLVLVYTSTIGLEAAIEGHKVIMCGKTHYRDKGFTCDPVDRNQYEAMVLSAPYSLERSREIAVLARRYAHLFFLRHMYPLPIIEERVMGNPRLTIDSLDGLRVGSSEELDYLCEFILNTVGNLEPEALIRKAGH